MITASYVNGRRIWTASNVTDVTDYVVNNFASYGQPYGPYDAGFDYNMRWDGTVELHISQSQMMKAGLGADITANNFPAAAKWASGSIVAPGNGQYSIAQLEAAGLISNADTHYTEALDTLSGAWNIVNGTYSIGDLNIEDAAYVFGTIRFGDYPLDTSTCLGPYSGHEPEHQSPVFSP
jgi:hypothetical protein